jgi:uncharacterized membrane protein
MQRYATVKFGISLSTALLVGLGCFTAFHSGIFSTLIGWITYAVIYAIQSLSTFLKVASNSIEKRCAEEDLSSWLLFSVLVITCTTALVSVSLVMNNRIQWPIPHGWSMVMCILAVALAWIVVHLSFTFRYAHLYYGAANKLYAKHANGLDFPDDEAPDYFDFAYYSFTIGMTFQVSDVVVKSKAIRRLTLAHSMLSFLFNTVIIAMTINEMVNLNHG